jgi:hypothetical protein
MPQHDECSTAKSSTRCLFTGLSSGPPASGCRIEAILFLVLTLNGVRQCVVPEGIRVRLLGGLDGRNVSLASFPASGSRQSTLTLAHFHAALCGQAS